MLTCSVNEQPPRSGSKICPICKAKIPFSLALHMMAAHSPEAQARSAKALDETLPNHQVPAHQESWSEPPSDAKRPSHRNRGKPGFVRKKGKGRH